MKVTIVGAGNVGAVTAQRLSTLELAREVVIVDVVEGIPQGKALDIYQAAPLVESDTRVIGTNSYEATAGSDVVIITAGLTRRPGMTRDDLLLRNAYTMQEVTRSVVAQSPECILIPVSNPLDEMTYVALRASGFDRRRVIGMAGVLDSARLRTFIAIELGVAVEDVSAIVLGSHGELMIPMIKYATIAGVPVTDFISAERLAALVERTRNAGTEILDHLKTVSAFYAPSAAITSMVESIALDKRRIMPCAVLLEGEYGLNDVVTGVPVKLGRNGVEQIIEITLDPDEREALGRSAAGVRANIAKLSI
ncbi:MAG TPA: malate dehydrogenase [Candidatus Kapabacteria bacterium]|nr:malate dehydrogenase [Candidatus Kapabacteria bacterium]